MRGVTSLFESPAPGQGGGSGTAVQGEAVDTVQGQEDVAVAFVVVVAVVFRAKQGRVRPPSELASRAGFPKDSPKGSSEG